MEEKLPQGISLLISETWIDQCSTGDKTVYQTIYDVNGRSYKVECRIPLTKAHGYAIEGPLRHMIYRVEKWVDSSSYGWKSVLGAGRTIDSNGHFDHSKLEMDLLMLAIRISDGS